MDRQSRIWTTEEAGVLRPIWKRVAPAMRLMRLGYRDADEEGTYNTLDHDEQGLFTAIVVAGEAEEKGSEHAVDGIGLR